MKTLLEETERLIKHCKLKVKDIIYIGSLDGYRCTWYEFKALASFGYDSGFGGAVIARDLIIAFKGGEIMTRGEYDGSEWWEVRSPFVIPEEKFPIKRLKAESYIYNDNLKSMNNIRP